MSLYMVSYSWKSEQVQNDMRRSDAIEINICQSLAMAFKNKLRFTAHGVIKITSEPTYYQSSKTNKCTAPLPKPFSGFTIADNRASVVRAMCRLTRCASFSARTCSCMTWGRKLFIFVVIPRRSLAEMQKFCNHLVSLCNSCEIRPGWQEKEHFCAEIKTPKWRLIDLDSLSCGAKRWG